MIDNNRMSKGNLYTQAQRDNRYDNIHKNFVLPQDKFNSQSSYQNPYPNKEIDYQDPRAFVDNKPRSTVENRQFEGMSSYNDAYQNNPNFNGRSEKIRQADNIKFSNEPFRASTQYTDQLKGYAAQSKTQRHHVARNQIFPKGNFEGVSQYNNSYLHNEARREPQFRPQGELKIGDTRFEGVSSYLSDYPIGKSPAKQQKITQKNNEIFAKGNFVGESTYLNSYVPSSRVERNKKFVPESQLKVGGKFEGSSSYLNDFEGRQAERTEKYIAPKNQTMPNGRFQSETSYLKDFNGQQGERAERHIVPQNETLPKGRFEGRSNYLDSYTGVGAEKQKQFRPHQEWKVEGEFQGNSSYLHDYKKHENAKRSSVIPLPINKFMPEGQFQATSSYQNSYVPNAPTRERQYRPEGQLKVGGQHFEGNSSYGNDYAERNHAPVPEKFKPKQNDVLPKGRFEGQSIYNENYVPTAIQRGQIFRPKAELEVGGKFQGSSNYTQQYHEKKGVRAQRVPLPVNQVIPEGRFDGGSNYTDTYVPTAVQRTQKVIMKSELQVGNSRFEGNSTYAQNYQHSPQKKQQYYPDNQYAQQSGSKQPRWNKKASRWE